MKKKKVKKIFISILSVFAINIIVYLSLVFSPNILYANSTEVDFVTIYHNQELEEQTENIIKDAIEIIKTSELYKGNVEIDLCLNDGSFYPKLMGNIIGGTAFAFYNKAVINHCQAKFNENAAEFKWEINNNELRKFNLTYLLAHEFTHNLQYHAKPKYAITSTMGKINWKLEGHAEYISRKFKNDRVLKDKIDALLIEIDRDHIGVPVFKLKDGTIQNLNYFKYGLVIQYLIEQEKIKFEEILNDKRTLAQIYSEMINWGKYK